MNTEYEWHVYEFSPIDHGWETMKTVQEMIATIANTPSDEPAWDSSDANTIDVASFLTYWESAKAFARSCGWEGDFVVTPRVFSIPRPDGVQFDIGFAFKQDNNGSSFLVSPVPLNFYENKLRGPSKKIYFAGKVQKDGWRQKLFGDRVMSDGDQSYRIAEGVIEYGGPFALSCDHGCFHFGMHALLDSACGSIGSLGPLDQTFVLGASHARTLTIQKGRDSQISLDRRQAVDFCLQCISRCQEVVAYIDSLDCYGTLIELGYATALGLTIHLYISEELFQGIHSLEKSAINLDSPLPKKTKDELWFLKNLPTVQHVRVGAPTGKNLPYSIFV